MKAAGYSRSPSPFAANQAPDGDVAVATVDDDTSAPTDTLLPNGADAIANSADDDNSITNPTESLMDRLTVKNHDESEPDDSLTEMVQSILNDSDNEVILNNMNMMGYNNIPAQWTENENTATNLSQSTKPQMNGDVDIDPIQSTPTTVKPEGDSKTSVPSTSSKIVESDRKSVTRSRRKYVLEWRTVIFIRHGKSKWNAAEGDPLSKVVAAGKGFFEYYKTKKLQKLDTKTNRKAEVDIMDAPLSREGIMESLNLCTYLREYTRDNQLSAYNELFEKTRAEMDDILQSLASAADDEMRQEMTDKLKQCLHRLDQFKVESLVANHPPQDDDNLRLPHPVPEIPKSPVPSTAVPNPPIPQKIASVESVQSVQSEKQSVVPSPATNSAPFMNLPSNDMETPIPSEVSAVGTDLKREEVLHRASIASEDSNASSASNTYNINNNNNTNNNTDRQVNSSKLQALNETAEMAPDDTAMLTAQESIKSQASGSQSPGLSAMDSTTDVVTELPSVDINQKGSPRRTDSMASSVFVMDTPTISPRSVKGADSIIFPDDQNQINDSLQNGVVGLDPNDTTNMNGGGVTTKGNEDDAQKTDTVTINGSVNGKSKNGKRYMQPIEDPQNPLDAEYVVDLLNGHKPKCGIVVSNLRRAMSTACICLNDRLIRRPYEKIQILGCLQEIGLNADTRPLLYTKEHKPVLAKTEKNSTLLRGVNMEQIYAERLSTKYYKGDASDKTAQQRLQEFALWLFAQRKYQHVVAIGHSHWFQSFFKAYLPDKLSEDELPAQVRKHKIRNCGVVAFRIQKRYVPSKSKRHGRHISFEIHPQSITTLKFSLYGKPRTNHEEMKEKSLSEEFESDNETENEMDLAQYPLGPQPPNTQSPLRVPQSKTMVATTKTPGILAQYPEGPYTGNQTDDVPIYDIANDKDDDGNKSKSDNKHQRPRIPDNSPPPVPPTNSRNIPNAQAKDRKESKESTSSKMASSFGKQKNKLMAFVTKIGGGASDKEEATEPANGTEQKNKEVIGSNVNAKVNDDDELWV